MTEEKFVRAMDLLTKNDNDSLVNELCDILNYVTSLKNNNTGLEVPKTCLTCHLFEDNSCMHPEVEDFYVPQYIHHSGCGLHELEEG